MEIGFEKTLEGQTKNGKLRERIFCPQDHFIIASIRVDLDEIDVGGTEPGSARADVDNSRDYNDLDVTGGSTRQNLCSTGYR